MEAIVEGYSEGHRARHQRADQRRQRPEPVPRPRRGALHAAAFAPRCCRASLATRSCTIAHDLGFTVARGALPRELLYIADEAFFVGTAAEVTPIRSVDKITIGAAVAARSPRRIQKAFFDIINGETPDRHGWLTFVYPGEPLQTVGAAGGAAAGTGRQR